MYSQIVFVIHAELSGIKTIYADVSRKLSTVNDVHVTYIVSRVVV